MIQIKEKRKNYPSWLKTKIPAVGPINGVKEILRKHDLHTVCEEALCPNIGECFGRKTATFMILGDICTRNCPFCAVGKGIPEPPDPNEPEKLAKAITELNLKHAVITSVDRDDLPDQGSSHFVEVIKSIRKKSPNTIIEVLTPDFQGHNDAIDSVVDANPNVFNHNIESVKRLHKFMKPKSDYRRSLELLKRVKTRNPEIFTKSGLIVGVGETVKEVYETMIDLREVNCDIITLGQYIKPPGNILEVKEYIHPNQFKEYSLKAKELGFSFVASGPLVRSSYNASEVGHHLSF